MLNMIEGFNPNEIFKGMVGTINKTNRTAGNENLQVSALFGEWSVQVEKEILNAINLQGGKATPEGISQALKISEDIVSYFISNLIRDKKVKVSIVEIIKSKEKLEA